MTSPRASMRLSSSIIVSLLLMACVLPARAQRQIAFDIQGTVFVITKDLEQRLAFFGIAGFDEARLFQETDSTYVLALTLSDSLGYRRTTRTVTPVEVQALRERWRLATGGRPIPLEPIAPPAEPLSDEGRARMVQTITGLGIGWYGWTLPAMIGSDTGPLPFTLYLFTAAATYFAADAVLGDRSYSEGEAAAFTYFATRGILHGYALNVLFTGEYDQLRSGFPVGTVVSLLEGGVASKWAARSQISVGHVKAMGTVGDAGLLLGLGGVYATNASDRPFFDDAGDRPVPYAAGVLVGNGLGLLAGWYVAGSSHYAAGDADLMESAGYLGAAAGFTLTDLSGVTDRRSQVAATMAGLALGQVVGGFMASSVDLSNTEGRRVGLMTSAGILIGLGIGYAIDQEAERSYYWSFVTLGGCAGLAGSYMSLRGTAASDGAGARLEWRPEGLVHPVARVGRGPLAEVRPFARLVIPL